MNEAPPTPENTLTVQEIESAHLASHDLGPGYPQLTVPEYVRRLYRDDVLEELSLRFSPHWTPHKQQRLDEDLERALTQLLRLHRPSYDSVRSTFSGSIALDRTLRAVCALVKSRGCNTLDVITTTPSIDIMRLFLEERREIRPRFVRSRNGGVMGALDIQALLDELQRCVARNPKSGRLLLLSSPENPTGSFWSHEELIAIGEACSTSGAILLMDHTFVTSGVHQKEVPRIWDMGVNDLEWLAVWDTGKTFGLNEDKLGFIISGSSVLTSAIDESLAVLQFGVARRQKLFFSELLRQADFHDHLLDLRKTCSVNLAALLDATAASSITVRPPGAGSLVLIDIGVPGWTDEQVRQRLLAVGVGVVAGNVFFHDKWRPRQFLRLALARNPDHFRGGVERLVSEVACLGA